MEKLLLKSDIDCLGLDLDVCVSPSMRDNFAKGIYPSLSERREFAKTACQYVESEIAIMAETYDTKSRKGILVLVLCID